MARLGLVAVIGMAFLVVGSADGQTRGQFTEQADAICKQTFPKVNRKIKKANRLLDRDDFDGAGRLVNRAIKSYRHALGRISDLSRPPDDAVAIFNWLYVKYSQARTLEAAAKGIRREDAFAISRALYRFDNLKRQANRQGTALGLHRCAGA